MKSITKNKLSESMIGDIVLHNFGVRTESIEEAKGGWFNSAYVIRLEKEIDGRRDVILKAAQARGVRVLTYEKQVMRAEIEVYRRLEGKNIPMPSIIKYDFSRAFVDFDYFFMSKLYGAEMKNTKMKINVQNLAGLKEDIGACFHEMHSVKGDYFGYIKDDLSFRFGSWREAFCSMLENVIKDGKDSRCRLPYEKVMNKIERFMPLLDEVTEPSLVHADLWSGNVFLKKCGDRYVLDGIIDFERCFYGDPFFDYAAAFGVVDQIDGEIDVKRGIERASGQSFTVSKNDKIRITLYRIYVAMIWAAENYRYPKPIAIGMVLHVRGRLRRLLKELEK